MRAIYIFLPVAIAAVMCGCRSGNELDLKYLTVSGIFYHDDSGKLDIRGEYREKEWGIDKIQAMVYDDIVELSTVRKASASGSIACRITVPPAAKEVRFCGKSIWKRPEPAAKAAGSTNAEPEKKPSGKEKTASKNTVPDKPEKIRHLQIGGKKFFILSPENMTFEEIFWGREVPVSSGVEAVNLSGVNTDSINAVMLNKYPDLEILEIKGNIWDNVDLTGLSLPKLKKLVIDSVEVKGLQSTELPELEEFYLNDLRSVPLGKIALPERSVKVHTVGIQAFAGNFDFNSLAGKPVKNLRIHGDLRRFGFLEKLPVENLYLSGFTAGKGALELLRALPLRSLTLRPHRRMADWEFLAGLTKLEFLDIVCRGENNFSPRLLAGLPLKVLRYYGSATDCGEAWMSCRELPLEELILRNTAVPEKLLLAMKLRDLAVYNNCVWHIADPVLLFNALPGLRRLALPGVEKLNWHRFKHPQLRALCLSGSNIDFTGNLPQLTALTVRDSGSRVILPRALAGREMDVLFFPGMRELPQRRMQQDLVRHNIRVKRSNIRDVFAAY